METHPKNLNAGPFDKTPPLIHAVALPSLPPSRLITSLPSVPLGEPHSIGRKALRSLRS